MRQFRFTLLVFMLAPLVNIVAQGTEPVLFGRDVISTGDFEFKVSFTPDQKRIYFSKAGNNWNTMIVLYCDKTSTGWSAPELASFSSGTFRDADPAISHDGSKMYFISDRPAASEPYKDFNYSIYSISLDKKGNAVGEPQKVAIPVAETIKPVYPSIAKSGNLYFSAVKDKDQGIYVSEWKDGSYQTPTLLSFNTDTDIDLDPVVSFDESFIIFTSNRKGSGKMDLWISFQKNGEWSAPVNLGPTINSADNEGQAGLSHDQKKLYFTATREPKIEKQPNRKVTYAQLKLEWQAVNNGTGNIYEVDITELIKSLDPTVKP